MQCSSNALYQGSQSTLRIKIVEFPAPGSRLSNPITATRKPGAALYLEYFCRNTLPMLRCTQPYPFWSAVGHLLDDPDSSLRHIASAMGYQHLALDSGQPASPNIELTLTTQAIRALRDSITKNLGAMAVEHMVAAVFFTALESLRGSCSQTMIHLEHGIRLGREKHSSTTALQVQDCLRVLDDHARNVVMLGADSKARYKGRELLIGSLEDFSLAGGVKLDDDSSVQTAVHLLESTCLAIGHQYSTSRQVQLRDYFESVWAQAYARVKDLEAIVDRTLSDPKILDNQPRLIQYHMIKARCLMMRPWTSKDYAYSLTDYDTDVPLYIALLDHVEKALDLYRTSVGLEGGTRVPSFSIGLGVHRTILATIAYCRDPPVRRRAIRLLDKAPGMEGPWSAAVTRGMGKTIIAYEEERAEKIIGRAPQTAADVPEQCRIILHHPINVRGKDERAPPTLGVKVYRVSPDDPGEILSERLEQLLM